MQSNDDLTRKLDHTLAAPMFVLSVVCLAVCACLLYLHELHGGGLIVRVCLVILAVLYPVFWLETAAHIYAKSGFMKQHIWFCLIPFTRIGGRDHETGQEIWLPRLHWRELNLPFEKMLVRKFSVPMILIALMVLPVVGLAFLDKDFVNRNPGLFVTMKITEAFIWAAFTFEFTLMLWVVKYPMGYARKHWIDLAIILLPTLVFMRSLRLASILRVKQIARTARIYRLRGLGMRMWRGFVALEVIELLLARNPVRRLEKLEAELDDKHEEIRLLKKDIRQLRKRIEKKKQEDAKKKVDQTTANQDSGTLDKT